MKGYMLTIKVDGTEELKEFDRPPSLTELKAGIGGGYLEAVPYFTTIVRGMEMHKCIAYCDEEGKLKGLPPNGRAQTYWNQAYGQRITKDLLVGDIVVLWGDAAFMRAM